MAVNLSTVIIHKKYVWFIPVRFVAQVMFINESKERTHILFFKAGFSHFVAYLRRLKCVIPWILLA